MSGIFMYFYAMNSEDIVLTFHPYVYQSSFLYISFCNLEIALYCYSEMAEVQTFVTQVAVKKD